MQNHKLFGAHKFLFRLKPLVSLSQDV